MRPTGPAATEPSAPKVNLLESSLSAPRAFITSMIKSVEEPPIWKPTLPPSMRTVPGADQPVPLLFRQANCTLFARDPLDGQEWWWDQGRSTIVGWAFSVERVTGIEPALSASESAGTLRLSAPTLAIGLPVSDRS